MDLTFDFAGKRVLVTGTDTPIGAGTARAFLALGGQVAVNGGAIDGAQSVAGETASADGCKSVVETAIAQLGGLDILVNAASYREDKPFELVTPQDWDKAIDGALTAHLFCTQFALPALQESKGNIVNVTSSYAQMGSTDGSSAFSAAAGSIVNMTRMLALRFGVSGVRANCLCAGPLEGSAAAQQLEVPPIGRHGTADDMVPTILFLASRHASFMTGAIIVNDGGRYSGA